MLGVVQILVIALGMRFFERRWPLESDRQRRAGRRRPRLHGAEQARHHPARRLHGELSDHQRDRVSGARPGASRRRASSSSCRGCTTARSARSWSISRSTTSPPTGCIAPSTNSPGGGRCTACITASAGDGLERRPQPHRRRPADDPGAGRLRAVRRRPARRLRPDPDDRAPDRELVARQCRHELRPGGRAPARRAALPPAPPCAGEPRRAATSTTTISRRSSRSGTCCSARRSTTASTARPASTIRVIDADNGRGWVAQQVTVFGRFVRALAPRFSRAPAQPGLRPPAE